MVYNILDYGAKADGTLCTNQIQKAINDCFLNGGGEVVTPRCGYEPFPFVEGENIREVDLTGTTLSGFLDTPCHYITRQKNISLFVL